MSHYLHHLPGRLRLKARPLKNNEEKAEEIRALCTQLPGIEAIEFNLLTGSMLLRYDETSVNSAQSWDSCLRTASSPRFPRRAPGWRSKAFANRWASG
jgi:hypothetical protein